MPARCTLSTCRVCFDFCAEATIEGALAKGMAMDVILCHTTADFDTLGSAVGLTRLNSGAKIVLTGGAHPGVQQFLAFHRDEFALVEAKLVDPDALGRVILVDAQSPSRFGRCAAWCTHPGVQVEIYDHHPPTADRVAGATAQIEAVGATATLVTEKLAAERISLTPSEATVLALGIHVDTGSLTFPTSTARDARALAWLMERGVSIEVLAEFIEPGLSERLQQLLPFSLEQLQVFECRDQTIGSVALDLEDYTGGLSTLAATLLELQGLDVLLLAARYHGKVQVIGRARSREVPLNRLLGSLGGGGHPQAAAAVVREDRDPRALLDELNTALCRLIPEPLTARTLMSAPVHTVGPDCPVAEAQTILNEAGHTGLPVVDAGELVGIVTRRDLDLAVHRGYPHAPVRGYMTREVQTIPPATTLAEIKDLMVIHDIGRLPVLEDGRLVGIVTRTDVLRTLHGELANRG